MALKDVKSRIASVKNIQKITRAMEMVAAARLRRAEQRIEALRPYAGAIRRMTRQAAEAAGNASNPPILKQPESEDTVGILLVTGDRGLAGAFNSQIVRAGIRAGAEYESGGKSTVWYASGPPRRVLAGLPRPRGRRRLHGLHRPPGLRQRARDRRRPDGRLRRRRGRPRRDHLQPLRLAAHPGGHARDPAAAAGGDDPRGRRGDARRPRGRRRATTKPRTRASRRSSSTSPIPRRSCTA